MDAVTVNELKTARRVLTYFMCHHAMPDVTYFEKEKWTMINHLSYVQKMIENELVITQPRQDV